MSSTSWRICWALNHSADTCVQESRELSAWSGLNIIILYWLSLKIELQGIILPVGASNGCLCYCQQYFCSGWSKRVFPTFKSQLVNGCNGSIEIRENLCILQVKTSAGEASSGAVLWFFTPCSARLKTKAYCVEWKLGWPMLKNVVNLAQIPDFCKSISAGPNWRAVLCLKPVNIPWCKNWV